MAAAINAYWNLLPDAEPNYFNPEQTLSRLEAMALLARASTPVIEEIGNEVFTNAVGQSEYTDYASLVADDSYLSIDDKSLNEKTAVGSMSRGEYIYMLISNVFSAGRINSADIKKVTFNDCKNAGNIASQQKLNTEDIIKDYYESAELKYALDNPEKGCPEKMFKALVTAKELGIIGNDTRWDEAVTKEEAIQLYIDALQAYTKENGYPVDAFSGQGIQVEETTETTETNDLENESESTYASPKSEGVTQNYEVTEMDKQMQATEYASTYEEPNNTMRIGAVQKGEIVRVVGKVEGYNWYKIEQEDGILSYIDGVYLKEVEEKQIQQPEVQQPEIQQPEVQPSEVQQPEIQQPEVQQPSTNESYVPINPDTGEPYQPGDVIPGAGIIWMGDFSDVHNQPGWE